jgi:molecular chaperone GrpE
MSDEKANKTKADDAASEAAPEPAPEPAPEFSPDFPPESLDVEDLMPGLAEAIGAEAVASGVIAQLEADCFEMKDKLLRALAESENIRRRAERDRKDAETYGGTKLARDMLAVHDNLDRALSHVDDTQREQAKSFIEGVELTQRELLNAFTKHKIEKVTPAMGEKFDPNRHQAMFEAPIPGANPGTVIEVMQPGFTIADRLLRPALVGVAKAAPKAEPEAPATDPESTEAASGENSAE